MKVNNPNYLNGLTVSAEQINAAVEGGGAGLTPEQTTTLGKIDGITSSASEIDNSVKISQATPSLYFKKGIDIGVFKDINKATFSGSGAETQTLISQTTPFGNSYMRYGTTIGGGSFSVVELLDKHISLMQVSHISLYVLANSDGGTSSTALRFRNSSSKYFSYTFRQELLVNNKEVWHHLKIPISDFTSTGGMTLKDPITSINIIAYGRTGTTISFGIAGIVLGNKERPAITFTFDDANSTDYSVVYKKFKEYGIKGTSNVISEAVGTLSHFLTLEQMTEMHDYGWKFGIHGKDYKNFVTNQTFGEACISIKTCRDWLYDNGFRGNGLTSCGFPQGEWSDQITDYMTQLGITHGRSSMTGYSCYPLTGLYEIRLVSLQHTLEENKRRVDEAVKRGAHICFMHHTILDIEGFNEFIDYVAENYLEYVTTLPDWVEEYSLVE